MVGRPGIHLSCILVVQVLASEVGACRKEVSEDSKRNRELQTSMEPEIQQTRPIAADVPAPAASQGPRIVTEKIDDTWVFFYDELPAVSMQSKFEGRASISDGCLYVDGMIVIWDRQRFEELEQTILRLQDHKVVNLHGGGGGVSLSEGATPDQIPAVITDRCKTSTVWFSEPATN